MNWYKVAETAVAVTSAEFGAMTWDEKVDLAENRGITPATQRLFFTEKYAEKRGDPHAILWSLAGNPSITPETQRLFFTERYEWKGYVLQDLARNESIAPEIQPLFLTQEYPKKNDVLEYLAWNPSFLRGDFTTAQWRSIKNAARGSMRLLILSKRLEQIQKVAADIIRGKLKGGL